MCACVRMCACVYACLRVSACQNLVHIQHTAFRHLGCSCRLMFGAQFAVYELTFLSSNADEFIFDVCSPLRERPTVLRG